MDTQQMNVEEEQQLCAIGTSESTAQLVELLQQQITVPQEQITAID